MGKILISGFADEISPEFDEQLRVVKELGMHYISLRTADGISIADYNTETVTTQLLPRLEKYKINVSSLGSPIGKIEILDEEGITKQAEQLDKLCKICKILHCRYIRIFSFFIPNDKSPNQYREQVLAGLNRFETIAKKQDVILIHENEKNIYGDTGNRCLDLLQTINSPHLRAAFDFANFVQCGEDPALCWKLLKKYVSYIHIKDAISTSKENVPCGTGEGKIKEILRQAILEEGYHGFLTLEPHLVLFDALKNLETEAAENVIKENKANNGAEGYEIQYKNLLRILTEIGIDIFHSS